MLIEFFYRHAPTPKAIGRWLLLPLLYLVAMAGQATEVILAFSDVHSPSSSLDGAARINLISGQLQRMNVPPAMVLVKTADINRRNSHWLSHWEKSGHLLVNHGHRYHLLSRPDSNRYINDFSNADRQLRKQSHYHEHVYLEGIDDARQIARKQRWVPVYISLQVKTDWLNHYYQKNHLRHKHLDMRQLQQDFSEKILHQVIHIATLQQGIYPRAPVILQLATDDITAYLLPELIDTLSRGGVHFASPWPLFVRPEIYAMPATGNRQDYLAALIGLEPDKAALPIVIDMKELVTTAGNYGMNF